MEKQAAIEGLGLKKVAFVAMPFGTKPTELSKREGPASVNFDALWEKSISPALSELKYLPIRADNQNGSVIIKDMLEQLIHADLVLADVSIPNGNVYYEAGVRHAARETGCILLSAEWAKPLFDLAQIRQLPYPFPSSEPTENDYVAVKNALLIGIPSLAESAGPVFTLARVDPEGPRDSRKLKEFFCDVFQFQRSLREATIAATANDRSKLRELTGQNLLQQLPGYALRDLIVAVRDHLSWAELSTLVDELPEKILSDPFFLEHKAHALAKQGRYDEAIALLETVIELHGQTPERCGTLGGRYRELAREQRNRATKRQYLSQGIEAYRQGMQLDLNQYYCALKLLIALVERDRGADRDEAQRCATVARYAANRANELNPSEEWVGATLAVLAFFEQDVGQAGERIDAILDSGWTNWKLVGLVQDLESLSLRIDENKRGDFEEMLKDLTESLPVTQDVLMDRVLPTIKEASARYQKSQQVHARPAAASESIVSITNDGEETINAAGQDDFVVKNLTEAQEQYVVKRDTFNKRYTYVEDVDDKWKLYDPVGEVLAVEISRDLSTELKVGEEFFIMPSWDNEQIAREGDMLVSPLPALDEVYRIARKEFDETYKRVEPN